MIPIFRHLRHLVDSAAPMALDRITLTQFRNHAATRLDGTAQLNLLVGENGAGKTNILEALSLLAPGRGMRRAAIAEMAAKGGDGGFVVSAELLIQDQNDPVAIGTGLLAQRPGRRVVQVNGAETRAMRLAEWLAIGWLTPAMDRLFADSAGARRRYMDRMALALQPDHARIAARYESALRERNRLLSEDTAPDPGWLDAIELQLAETGATLSTGRARLIQSLESELASLPESPFARPALNYSAGGPSGVESLAAALRENRSRDRAAQRTLIGPHRDDLAVAMAGTGVPAVRSSTGEQKAMLISLTLAHSALAARGRPNLLLLDEIAAHLDPIRRAALFMRLRKGAAQVWMSGTEPAPFAEIAQDAAIWQVRKGAVERIG